MVWRHLQDFVIQDTFVQVARTAVHQVNIGVHQDIIVQWAVLIFCLVRLAHTAMILELLVIHYILLSNKLTFLEFTI